MSRLMDASVGDFESRKRALQRREVGQAYRRNAEYQTTKNPLLEALEGLLLGKAEKEQSTSGWNGVQDKEASMLEEVEGSTEKRVAPALLANGYGLALQEEKQSMDRFDERGALLPGRQMECQAYERLFRLASMNYSNHIAMVKNGYQSFEEPTFSKTA